MHSEQVQSLASVSPPGVAGSRIGYCPISRSIQQYKCDATLPQDELREVARTAPIAPIVGTRRGRKLVEHRPIVATCAICITQAGHRQRGPSAGAGDWTVDGAALVGDAGLGGTAGAEPVVVTDLSDCDEAPVSERSYPITKPAIATSATMPAIQTQVKGLFSAPKLRCGAVATSLESWRKSESRESVSRESV